MQRDNEKSELAKKEEALNQLKEAYEKNTRGYNETIRPFALEFMRMSRSQHGAASDVSVKEDKMKSLEEKLKNSESEVKRLLADLEKEMQEISRMERELYGKNAAEVSSPSILEQKHVYSKRK